jgi:hypothetical protein
MRISALFLLVAACGRPPSAVQDKPLPVQPACDVTMDDRGRLVSQGTTLGKVVDLEDDDRDRFSLVTWPRARTVLAAWTREDYHGPDGSPTLYEVSCEGPTMRRLVTRRGANFGTGVLARDGTRFYFAGPRGAEVVDLETFAVTKITKGAPAPKDCWTGGTLRDFPLRLHDGEQVLEIERGGSCGYEAEWAADRLRLDLATGRVWQPHPVTGLAAAANGTLWITDGGGSCGEPGITDRHTVGALWASTDGISWRKVPVKDLETAPAVVVAQARRLFILGGRCLNGGRGEWGGTLHVSEDGGASWRRLPTRPVDDSGEDGLLDSFLVGADDIKVQAGDRSSRSTDGGKTWSEWKEEKAKVATPPRKLDVGGIHYEATDDGLLRDGKRVFPRPR